MSRPRVLHLIKGLGRGGAEVLLEAGLARADASGYAYEVGYFLPRKDALVGAIEARGAPVRCFDVSTRVGMLLSTGRVAAWLRERGIDLVHAHLPLAGVVARVAGARAGVPVVYTEHNLQERYHPLTRRLNLATWRLQDRVVAVSEDVAESIRRHAPPEVPVRVVRNGVDVTAFDPAAHDGGEARRRHGVPAAAPLVGAVAVFRSQKRLDLWLEVARRVRDRRPETRFLLVGDGPLRDRLEAEARESGLDGAVVFAGLREEVGPYLAAMDVYLMTSEFEGLPIAILEAMAMERAIVSTAVGGVPEAIRDDREGTLREPGDVAGLAEAVERYLADPAARRAAGEAARRRAEARFGTARMAAALEAVYDEVLAGRAPGREVRS